MYQQPFLEIAVTFSDEQLQSAFNFSDSDGSGKISTKELGVVLGNFFNFYASKPQLKSQCEKGAIPRSWIARNKF